MRNRGNSNYAKLKHHTKLKFWVAAFAFLSFSNIVLSDEYSVNKANSTVKWEAKKVTGQHDGTIAINNGSLKLDGNQILGGSLVIDMKSIVNTDITDAAMNKKLVGHLWSDDFFSVEKFPESKLNIVKVEPKSGDVYHFVGDLTIKGITKPIEFDAKVNLVGEKLTANGVITINRTLYDVRYGSGSFFTGLGDKMIYDDFTLDFVLVADKK